MPGQRNENAAAQLDTIASLLALTGGTPFRVRAYEDAAQSLRGLREDVAALHAAGRLDEIPGVGLSIAAKLAEYLDTGRIAYLDELKQKTPITATEILQVPSIGPARAQVLYERLGITSVAELLEAARAHRLRGLSGIGPKYEERIAREAARVAQRSSRMLLGTALPAAEAVVQMLRVHPAVRAIEPTGSIRRMRETIGDIDILVSTEEPEAVARAFTTLPIVGEVLGFGTARPSVLTTDGLQIDLRILPPRHYGAGLLHFTGSREHSIAVRTVAIQRGWKLSEYGLLDQHGQSVADSDEAAIYHALGMDWIPPELRENRGEVEAAQRHALPELVRLENIKGDLHVHSDWSDGRDSPEAMVEAAIARGYQYIALTDHSASLRVAHGLSVERVREQRRLIDALNARYAPFRVLHGAEIDILPDGSLDYPDEVMREFDIVTVSVHRAFGQPAEKMTARIVRALRHPLVDTLNHPTGGLLLGRHGYDVDVDAVFAAAAERGVALEINGQPNRLDLSDLRARAARAAGVRLVCNSDAHATEQLSHMRYAVATARRGWVEATGVLNTLPLAALLEHLQRRRRVATP